MEDPAGGIKHVIQDSWKYYQLDIPYSSNMYLYERRILLGALDSAENFPLK